MVVVEEREGGTDGVTSCPVGWSVSPAGARRDDTTVPYRTWRVRACINEILSESDFEEVGRAAGTWSRRGDGQWW